MKIVVMWVVALTVALLVTRGEGQATKSGSAEAKANAEKFRDLIKSQSLAKGAGMDRAVLLDKLREEVKAAERGVNRVIEKEGLSAEGKEMVYRFVNRQEDRQPGQGASVDRVIASPAVRLWIEKGAVYLYELNRGK